MIHKQTMEVISMNNNKTTNQFSIIKRLLKYMIQNYKFSFLVVIICIILGEIATMKGSLFVQSLVDDYIIPLTQSNIKDYTPLFHALVRLAGLFIIGLLGAYAYNRIMVNVSQGTMKKLRIEVFNKMEALPIQYFDTHSHGDIMSIYTNDVDTLRQLFSSSIPNLFKSIVALIATFISMIVLNIPLTVITLLMACLMIMVTRKFTSLSGRYFVEQQNDLGTVNGYIEEMLDGQKVIKVFCHEDKTIKEFQNINNKLRESMKKANSYANMLMPINGNIGNISYVLCAVIGALLAINGYGGITIGTIIAFVGLNKNFTQPITQISQQTNSIVMAIAGAKRVFDLLDEESEIDKGIVTLCSIEYQNGKMIETDKRTGHWAWRHPRSNGKIELVEMKGDIRFENVNFGYTNNRIILHNINLYAKPGQKIAFVGATGAGKTTITNLINRFYDIQKGTITYDGIDIKLIKKNDLRRSLGIVLQDTHLFTGTVLENIRYGRLDATDEECIEAAKLANADAFIEHLSDGYQTVITGDGANLSQGQRQLLAIARAAVANPPVLILDEATSSIDTRTELLVQNGMDALMEGRTTFVIAHRLSTIKNSDCIMVMDHGRIIEAGNHEQLLQKKGKYYQLYTGNFKEE